MAIVVLSSYFISQQRELNIIIVQKMKIFSFSFRKLRKMHYLCMRYINYYHVDSFKPIIAYE